MSQAAIDQPQPADQQRPALSDSNEFHYVPVSPLAPVACFLGVASAVSLITVYGFAIGLVGIIVGLIAVVRIRKAEGDLGGGLFAWIGLILSVGFLVAGVSMQSVAYATEVPEGALRTNFPTQISKNEFIVDSQGQRAIHPAVVPLLDKFIFTKGWMYNTNKSKGLDEFVLLKDNGECCFGGEPKPFDMIVVKMKPGLTTRSYTSMISVAGTLKADPSVPEGAAVYTLEDTELVELSRSSF